MVSPAPIPLDETARLASLQSYRILDSSPDERFDLFTKLGTWLFNTPICAIHFIGRDTTFFKSVIGFDSYQPRRETSVCAHAVGLGDPVMAVEDLSKDLRFNDHPLFVKRGMRFYAGALLRSSSNHALGTFCIADVVPRVLSEEERHKLLAVASGVANVLELHRCGLQLLDDVNRDVLTGLANRRHFDTALRGFIERAGFGSPFALMFLDIDRFKSINDTLGHAVGDSVICEIGRRLGACSRGGDMVARLAGDEFVVLMAGAVDRETVAHMATRILTAIAAPYVLDGIPIELNCSIGIALCPDHASTAPELLRQADIALYEAKQSGRNCFRLFRSQPAYTP